MKGNAPGGAQSPDMRSVSAAFRAQTMIKVRSGQCQLFKRPQGQKQAEQRRGIDTSG